MKRFYLLFFLLLLAIAVFAADPPNPYGAATVSPFKKVPVIDGVLNPGEWDGAMCSTGFQQTFNQCLLDARVGATYFGFTEDALYIAVVSEYPPDGKDHSSGIARDRDYVFDESIEIWIDPNRANRKANTGDLRFYQMNMNAQGGIYDISFDPKKGPSTGWNGNWELKSTVNHQTHTWVAELSLPFADLGWKKGEVIDRALGILVARNYKGPWEQATWFRVGGAFIDWFRYAEIRLLKDAPSVQVTGLGEQIFTGRPQIRATVTNPGPARQAKVSVLITSSDMPELKDEKVLELPAGGKANYALDTADGRFHEQAQQNMTLTITSPDGKEVYYNRVLSWTKAPEKKWLYRVGPDPEAAVRFAYYPSYKFVRVQVDPRELGKEFDAVRSAKVTITGPGNKVVLDATMSWADDPGRQEYKVGDLADGDYTLTVTVPGWKDPFVRKFKRTHFPWEGNTLGISDQVLPPFTPITVKKNTLGVVSREYRMNGLGLCDQITSLGHPLLAQPMALVANGGETLKGKGTFTAAKPNMAVFMGKATSPAVTVSAKTTTEVDGCMKVELTLAPGSKKQELKSLWLDIPLKDAEVPLYHVSTAGLRINPSGSTPAGEGEVWSSKQFPDGNWYGNFKCYLWLGAEERGLCWFADNDAGWVLQVDERNPDKCAPCQQFIRKDGVLTLRINLVQQPITLDAPRTIVFGVMASPAKPMETEWRRVGIDLPSNFTMGYATPASYCAKAPWGNDFSIYDWAYNQRTGKGGPSKEQIEAWKARNFPADMDPAFREGAINLALGPFLSLFRPGPAGNRVKVYFEEFHTTAQIHPESHVFQSEWTGNWYGPLLDHATQQGHKGFGIGTGGIVASYRDFACWYAAEWVKRGIGCYFDNSMPQRAYDTLTTNAYRLPNGEIQPSAGIWARREYLKRIWYIHHTMAPADAKAVMMIHMTNTHIIPYMDWNDENLDLEWKFGPEPQQAKFPLDFLRAESIGRQSGNVPFVLALVQDPKTKEEGAFAERTRFGVMMVHEIRTSIPGPGNTGPYKILTDFGYGKENCKVYNYWQSDYPMKASDPEAKSLLLHNGNAVMLVVCTWNAQPSKVTFTLDLKALGLKPTTVENAEKPGETVTIDPNTGAFTLDLEGYGVRILKVR